MKFAIVGCGLIGNKRAAALPAGPLAVLGNKRRERGEAGFGVGFSFLGAGDGAGGAGLSRNA